MSRLSKVGPDPIPDTPEDEASYSQPVTRQAPTAPDEDGYEVPVEAAEPPRRPSMPEQPQLSIHPIVAAMMQQSRQSAPAQADPVRSDPAQSAPEPMPVPASQGPETIKSYRSMSPEERIRAFKGLNNRNYNSGTLSRY
jgi:hypothetical protein